VRLRPEKICIEVAANSNAARVPETLVKSGIILGALIMSRAAAQSAAPAANSGLLASRDIADPETTSVWPAMNTRKPAPTSSRFRRRKWKDSSAAATTSSVPSRPQAMARSDAEGAKLPASPRSAPKTRQMGATEEGRSVDMVSKGRRRWLVPPNVRGKGRRACLLAERHSRPTCWAQRPRCWLLLSFVR